MRPPSKTTPAEGSGPGRDDGRCSPPLRVSLVGLAMEVMGAAAPNLAVYNLRAYACSDPELAKRVAVTVHDLPVTEPEDRVLAAVAADRPNVVGLSCYSWNSAAMLRLAEGIRTLDPAAIVLLGGPDATFRAGALLARHPAAVDAVVAGEGEEVFRLLLRRLADLDAAPWTETPGLVVRDGAGCRAHPPPEPLALSRVPAPLDDPDFRRRHPGLLVLETARGCRHRCAYCTYGVQSPGRRLRPLGGVVRALRAFAASGGGKVWLLDPGLNQEPRRFRALVRHLAAADNLTLVGAELNLATLHPPDLAPLAGRVGDFLIFGLQSSSPRALRQAGRTARLEAFGAKARLLRQAGLPFSLDVIYGLPGDDYAAFSRTLDAAFAMEPNFINCFRLQVLPGSRFAHDAERLGLRHQPEPPYHLESCPTFSAGDMARAERLARALTIFHQFTYRTEIVGLMARELERRPAEVLEDFLAGRWRGAPLNDSELARLASPVGQPGALPALRLFLAAASRAARRPVLLRPLDDLLRLQHHWGRLRILAGCSAPPSPPVPAGAIRLAGTASILNLDSDALALIETLAPLAAVDHTPRRLVMYLTGDRVEMATVGPEVARVLEWIGPGASVATLEAAAAAHYPDTPRAEVNRSLHRLLNDLVRRGVLVR
ncbi:MAG TPA: radical SAM protein [Acidobacteriota bacterium]|nr:radical SAM protein [Acidobacteriota bacterium]HQF88546.1 radical SAM protein [Acidobacteriota bacterium]HQG92814.1 radical SAM protein [Acidobacteriota bacterium]